MLEDLLYPKVVAVIGASRTPGKVGHEIFANLVKGGFAGTVVPINPSADDVLGVKCYPDLKTFGQKINLSVIAVPTKFVKAAAESSMQAGAKAIVVITAGFKEVGPEGAKLEKELAQMCRAQGVRLMGPNCLGLLNGASQDECFVCDEDANSGEYLCVVAVGCIGDGDFGLVVGAACWLERVAEYW